MFLLLGPPALAWPGVAAAGLAAAALWGPQQVSVGPALPPTSGAAAEAVPADLAAHPVAAPNQAAYPGQQALRASWTQMSQAAWRTAGPADPAAASCWKSPGGGTTVCWSAGRGGGPRGRVSSQRNGSPGSGSRPSCLKTRTRNGSRGARTGPWKNGKSGRSVSRHHGGRTSGGLSSRCRGDGAPEMRSGNGSGRNHPAATDPPPAVRHSRGTCV